MTVEEALGLLKCSKAELSRLLGIDKSAVSLWGDNAIPLAREYQIRELYKVIFVTNQQAVNSFLVEADTKYDAVNAVLNEKLFISELRYVTVTESNDIIWSKNKHFWYAVKTSKTIPFHLYPREENKWTKFRYGCWNRDNTNHILSEKNFGKVHFEFKRFKQRPVFKLRNTCTAFLYN